MKRISAILTSAIVAQMMLTGCNPGTSPVSIENSDLETVASTSAPVFTIASVPTSPANNSYTMTAFSTVNSGTFIISDGSVIKYSKDNGKTWTASTIPTGQTVQKLKSTNNKFFAFTRLSDGDRCLLTSSDGVKFTSLGSWSEEKPMDIVYGSSKYVVVQTLGYISYFTSVGGTWQNDVYQTEPSATFAGVMYGNSKFVAVSQNGTVHSSTDGKTWKQIASGLPGYVNGVQSITSVAFANKVFGVATSVGFYSSADGITWKMTGSTTGKAPIINSANNKFFYTADSTAGTTSFGLLMMSSNGTSWTRMATNVTSVRMYEVAFGNSTYIAGSSKQTVATGK